LVSIDQAAEMMKVSRRSVVAAKAVLREGVPELADKVSSGEIAVSVAAAIARAPAEQQREILGESDKKAISQTAKRIRAEREITRRAERIEKIAEIAKGNAPLAAASKFPVIYADPPWRYDHAATANRQIENHYPTMSLDEICAMPVQEIATDDAILYMWATAPKLAECMQVLSAWGFDYRTNFVWVKDKIGMGYHARSQHEILLVAKRGNIPPPAVADRVSSVVMAERGEHSAKPAVFYELIESFYPTLPKIELFCRSPREGWAVWGNQAERAA
jgi:N6-adenosine-specific RNA methylase IME4